MPLQLPFIDLAFSLLCAFFSKKLHYLFFYILSVLKGQNLGNKEDCAFLFCFLYYPPNISVWNISQDHYNLNSVTVDDPTQITRTHTFSGATNSLGTCRLRSAGLGPQKTLEQYQAFKKTYNKETNSNVCQIKISIALCIRNHLHQRDRY